MTARVVALIQARMSSQRLPGKVLRPLPGSADSEAGHVVLDWVVARTRAARTVDEVVVATSTESSDDALAEFCAERGYAVFRGDLHDVLRRMADAATAHDADAVVRITGDCPLVDPDVVDAVVRAHLEGGHDFTANRLPPPAHRTYPIGLDVEIARRAAFDVANQEATDRAHREHVMPFLYENAGRFDVHIVESDDDAGEVRWTVDTPQDLEAVTRLVQAAAATTGTPWRDLLRVWREHPALAAINASVVQRTAAETDPRSPDRP